MILVNNKTGNPPQLVVWAILKVESSIVWSVLDSGKLVLRAILAPSYRFSLCIENYSVRLLLFDEVSFFSAVPDGYLSSGPKLLVLGKGVRQLMVISAPAPPSISYSRLQEEPFKIRPSLL